MEFVLPLNPEPDSVALTLEQTGGETDPASPHTIYFDSDTVIIGRRFKRVVDSNAVGDGDFVMTSGNGAPVGLKHNAVYTVTLVYRAIGFESPPPAVVHPGVIADLITEGPRLVTPTTDLVLPGPEVGFDVEFELPETPTRGTTELYFMRTGGFDDPRSPHRMLFTDNYRQKTFRQRFRVHSFVKATQQNPKTVAAVSCGLAGDEPPAELQDGTIYKAILAYKDALGNSLGKTMAENLRFDAYTEMGHLLLPEHAQTISEHFKMRYRLTEAARNGTVTMTFAWTDGPVDLHSPHVVLFSDEASSVGLHDIQVQSLALAKRHALVADVTSYHPSGPSALVASATYSVTLAYQDVAGNPASMVHHNFIKVDMVTKKPLIFRPRTGEVMSTGVTGFWQGMNLEFELLERAKSGTVKVIWTRMHGAVDTGSPHEITLGPKFELPTDHSVSVGTPQQMNPDVKSWRSNHDVAQDLKHGTYYQVTLQYQDRFGNSAAKAVAGNVLCDKVTDPPQLMQPEGFSPVTTKDLGFPVSFWLPEPHRPGSVKMTLRSTTGDGGVQDWSSPHVITFTNYDASQTKDEVWRTSIGALTNATLSSYWVDNSGKRKRSVAKVESGVGGDPQPLVDGAVYSAELSYRDRLGNPRAMVLHRGLRCDLQTLPPEVVSPAPMSTVSTYDHGFLVQYRLPETAGHQALHIQLERFAGSPDPFSPHVLTLGTAMETKGLHSLRIGELDTASLTALELTALVDAAHAKKVSEHDRLTLDRIQQERRFALAHQRVAMAVMRSPDSFSYLTVGAEDSSGHHEMTPVYVAIVDKFSSDLTPTVSVSDLTFEDTDPHAWTIGGEVTWTPPADLSGVSQYTTFVATDAFGANKVFAAADVLAGVNSARIPAGTKLLANKFLYSHILVYTRSGGGLQSEPVAIKITDRTSKPPASTVASVTFVDMDTDLGEVGGNVTWTPEEDVLDVTGYAVYLATSAGGSNRVPACLEPVGCVFPATAHHATIPQNIELESPYRDRDAYAYILVYTRNVDGESAKLKYAYVTDVFSHRTPPLEAVVRNMRFTCASDTVGTASGTVSWTLPSVSSANATGLMYATFFSTSGRGENKLLIAEDVTGGQSHSTIPDGVPFNALGYQFTHVAVYARNGGGMSEVGTIISVKPSVGVFNVKFLDVDVRPLRISGTVTWTTPDITSPDFNNFDSMVEAVSVYLATTPSGTARQLACPACAYVDAETLAVTIPPTSREVGDGSLYTHIVVIARSRCVEQEGLSRFLTRHAYARP